MAPSSRSKSKKCPRPLLRFNVKPFSKRKEYVVVHVWPTKAAMLAYSDYMHHCADESTGAYCQSYDRFQVLKDQGEVLMGDFAEINLHLEQISTETVTHELFHATMALCYRLGFLKKLVADKGKTGRCSDAEEDAAYAHGRMCRLVTNKLHHAGYWT